MPILAKTTPATHADAASPSSLYRRPRPKLHQRPTPTLTTMPRIRAFLRTRQSQLDAGEGVYIVHRVEVGRLRLFLDQVKLAMPQARCFYMLSP